MNRSGELEAAGEGVGVWVGLAVGVGVGVGVWVGLAVAVGVGVGECVGVTVGDCVGAVEVTGVGVAVGTVELTGVGVAVGALGVMFAVPPEPLQAANAAACNPAAGTKRTTFEGRQSPGPLAHPISYCSG